jgi:hypothetical protein
MICCLYFALQIGDLVKEVEPYAGLWHVVSEYALKTEDWMYGNMQTLNPEEIDELVSSYVMMAGVRYYYLPHLSCEPALRR